MTEDRQTAEKQHLKDDTQNRKYVDVITCIRSRSESRWQTVHRNVNDNLEWGKRLKTDRKRKD